MKRSILNRRWLAGGLASLVVAGASVALGQSKIPYNSTTTTLPTGWTRAILWTYETGISSWSGDGYAAGGLTSFTSTFSSSYQSPLYNPSTFGNNGGDLMSGLLGPTAISGSIAATWSRAHPGYNGSGLFNTWNQNPGNYDAVVFDYKAPISTPLDSKGGLPTITVWLQYGTGTSATIGNNNNNGGTVPLQYAITADGQWHTAILFASLFQFNDGGGNFTQSTFNDFNLYWLHDFTFGVSDSNYSANTTVSIEFDNIGFAGGLWPPIPPPVPPGPEPSSLALFSVGALALGLVGSYRRKLHT